MDVTEKDIEEALRGEKRIHWLDLPPTIKRRDGTYLKASTVKEGSEEYEKFRSLKVRGYPVLLVPAIGTKFSQSVVYVREDIYNEVTGRPPPVLRKS
ncbi:hypothetical protein KJA15_01545 [Patescibacteria group bacterium]|nr:hypothetical protein [Patescibacteria group bacterium]